MTDWYKLKRVMNYLTGTGFRTGRIAHPAISLLRRNISAALKEFKTMEEDDDNLETH